MKLHIKLLVVLLTVIGTSTVIAKTDSIGSATFCKVVAAQEDKMYKLVFNSPIEQDVTIKLYNEKNELVHSEEVSAKSGFVKKYDLSYMPLGAYKVQVQSVDFHFSEDIDLGGLSEFNLRLTEKGEHVILTGSHPEGKDLTLYIFDDQNELVFKDDLSKDAQVKKTYNLEKVISKGVTFMIYHEESLLTLESFEL